jgi:hypothetical protein
MQRSTSPCRATEAMATVRIALANLGYGIALP